MTSVEKDDHVELNLNLSFNKKNIHPETHIALSNDVTLSFIKGLVNATN